MAKYILSCRPSSYGRFILNSYEHLSEIGVKNVEVDLPADLKAADMMLDMFQELDLHALSVSFPIDVENKSCVENFKKSIPALQKMKPMYIFSSVKIGKEKNRAKGYPILKQLGDIAAQNNVFFSVETHPFYNTNGSRGKETMENVNSPGMKINFDTANIYYYNENISGVEEMKKILPWLGSLHIKDSLAKPKDWSFMEIGKGKVDFPGTFKVLDSLNQTIPLTLEIEGIKGEVLNLDQTKTRVVNSIKYLRDIGVNFS